MTRKIKMKRRKLLAMATLPMVALMVFSFRPSESTTAQTETRKSIWLDLVTPDMKQSKKFYEGLFGWTFVDENHSNMKNCLVKKDNTVIASIFQVEKAGASSWIPAASASAIDVSTKSETLLNKGSKVAIAQMNIPGRGKQIVLEGPQGEEFSIIAGNSYHENSTVTKADGTWMGAELWASDVESAKSFYEYAFGAKLVSEDFDGKPYWFFERDGQKIAGMIKNPVRNQGTQWVPYIYHSDVAGAISKVEALGGKIILAPTGGVCSGKLAIIQDPNGALFCIHSNK